MSLESGRSIRAFIEASAPLMPDLPDPIERLSGALRLWAGCLMAAKEIADATLSGPNTPESRQQRFPMIENAARNDAIFEAGIEAEPARRRRLKGWK